MIEFEEKLIENLKQLQKELITQTYLPKPLQTFILRDPKTRKISKSAFRDRIVHHAICNVIEPFFSKGFIFDSFANRVGKGTLAAIKRFDHFKQRVSKGNTRKCYVLKADIKQYFENVNHNILLSILKRKIKDEMVLQLIKKILSNYDAKQKEKGMPLGNLTSQYFANVYLNELDQYVKHKLRAKYYIRYVDDFVFLHHSPKPLRAYKRKVDYFLREKLGLQLHPHKSKIILLRDGVSFLGLCIFPQHKLVRKKNLRKFERKFNMLKDQYQEDLVEREKVVEFFEGWLAYASHADTYKYRRKATQNFNMSFPIEKPIKITHAKKHQKFTRKIESSGTAYTTQKTLLLFKKGLSVKEIAEQRGVKESTIWSHLSNLIEHHQLSLYKVVPKEKVEKIRKVVQTGNEKLKSVKEKIADQNITYNEIACVCAYVRSKHKKRNLAHLAYWYKKTNCYRKCYVYPDQRKICSLKFDRLVSQHPTLQMTQKEFLHLFNNHMTICVLPEKEKRKFVSWSEFKEKNKKAQADA